MYKAIIEHHISPEEAGKLFAKTKPKLAVYTHLVLSGLPAKGIPFPTHEELLAATRKTYDGRVMVGKDLMSFKIDDTGVSVIEPPRKDVRRRERNMTGKDVNMSFVLKEGIRVNIDTQSLR